MLPFEQLQRKILVRETAQTDPAHGCEPEKRDVPTFLNYGMVNINKPSGPSSHQVSAYVQQILGIDKAGHSGTLDPKVTGCLPVALGKATRVVQALLPAGKEYVCVMHLHADVPETKVRDTLARSVGRIKQLPPIKSAVKRQWRERDIYSVDFIEMKEKDVLFRIGCEGGTYIRKFCSDFGQQLGVGAHMAELIRTQAGPFRDESMITLQDLRDAMWYYKEQGNETFLRACIQPVESAVAHLGHVTIFDNAINSICHGRDLGTPGITHVESDIEKGELIAIMSLKGELIALGESRMSSHDMIERERGIAVKTLKVFMEPTVYPKYAPLGETSQKK